MSLIKFMKRSSLLAGAAYAVMALAPQRSVAQEATGQSEDRAREHLITTQGIGEVRVRPDALRVRVGVEAQATTVAEAQSEVNTRMTRVIQAIRGLGITGLVLQTETLQLSPITARQEGNELPRIVGYRAENSVSATVRGTAFDDLGTQASRIADTAVRAGANTLGGINFFAADLRDAQQRSLREAVSDAQQNARTMASAAGVTLGALASLDGAPQGGSRGFFEAAGLMRDVASTPVETGEIVITSRVNASFIIQPRR